MSSSTNESEDGVLSKDQMDSPSIDEGSCGEGLGVGAVLKKGPWTPAEDAILVDYVNKHGEGNWNAVQKHSGLFRCGKSCRLRWANHLRPNLKKGAFTADEEQLIIELHAKMGNKWARMAAHLPGRTDNEIKNYWNTRIKRQQRAGLPLYPPDVCLQAVNEIQQTQNTSGFNSGHTQHDLLQPNNFETSDVIFGNLNAKQGIFSFAPVAPDISIGSMLTQGLGSSQNNSFMPPAIPPLKRFRESENLFPGFDYINSSGFPPLYQFQNYACGKKQRSFGLSYPYDPDDPRSKNSPPFGARPSSHALLNGNISASKPINGAVKLELPSLQFSETDGGTWGMFSSLPPLLDTVDAFIQSPLPSGQVQSDCLSPRNSGLLEALLHESKTLNMAKNQSSDKSMNSSVVTPSDILDGSILNPGETEWGEFSDPISPLGRSVASVFGDCTPINGSSLNELPLSGSDMKPGPLESSPFGRETQILDEFKISRTDASLGAGHFDQSYECAKDNSIMTDTIATLLGEDLCSDYKHMLAGTSAMSQGCGPGSIPWNNLPAFCQMPELP